MYKTRNKTIIAKLIPNATPRSLKEVDIALKEGWEMSNIPSHN